MRRLTVLYPSCIRLASILKSQSGAGPPHSKSNFAAVRRVRVHHPGEDLKNLLRAGILAGLFIDA